MEQDPRFTFGLIHDICEVLHEHGYERADSGAMGRCFEDISRLVLDFEGAPSRNSELVRTTGALGVRRRRGVRHGGQPGRDDGAERTVLCHTVRVAAVND